MRSVGGDALSYPVVVGAGPYHDTDLVTKTLVGRKRNPGPMSPMLEVSCSPIESPKDQSTNRNYILVDMYHWMHQEKAWDTDPKATENYRTRHFKGLYIGGIVRLLSTVGNQGIRSVDGRSQQQESGSNGHDGD